MADLQEALAARERRSRLTAVIIGGIIILVIGFIIFQIARSNSDDNASNDNGENTEEQEVVDVNNTDGDNEEVAGGVDLDSLFSGDDDSSAAEGEDDADATEEDNEANPDTAASEGDDDADAIEENDEADNSGAIASTGGGSDLPNTGPAENAVIAIVALGILGGLYAQSRGKLSAAKLQ